LAEGPSSILNTEPSLVALQNISDEQTPLRAKHDPPDSLDCALYLVLCALYLALSQSVARLKPARRPYSDSPTTCKALSSKYEVRFRGGVRYTHLHSLPPMTKSKLQINLEYAVARVLLAMFAALPLRAALAAGSTLGRWGYYFSGRLRRTGLRNLELAFPELDQGQRKDLLRGCFQNLGRLLGVFSHFSDASPQALREMIECEGLDHLDAASKSGRGVILFTGHVGAWELSSFALSLFDHPLSFLVRRIDNPKIEALVDRARIRRGNRTVDKRSAAREILRILQAGGTLGILVDLNTLDREGIFVDFFGRPASTTFTLAKLALRTGALVLPVFVPWDEQRQRFVLKIEAPLAFTSTGDEQDDVRRFTQLFTSVVERYVRQYPSQWLWIHRRWKTRPPGEPGLY